MIAEIFKDYNDSVREMDIMEFQLEAMENERENWWIGGKFFHLVPMDVAAEKFDKLTERIELYRTLLDMKKKDLKAIEEKMSGFESIERKVAYKRLVEKKTIKKIAEELDYSERHIERISGSVSRKLSVS